MNNVNTKEKTMSKVFKVIKWSDVWLCVFAFVCARVGIVGEFYTLGVAYLGTLYFTRELQRWSSIFALLGFISLAVFDINILKYICITAFIIGIRMYMNLMDKELNERNQSVIVGIGIVITSLVVVYIKGVTSFDILISLLEGAVGAGVVLVLSYGVKVLSENRKTCLTTKETVSMTVLFACILAGMIDVYVQVPLFLEIYLRDVLTFCVLIAVTYLGGMNIGVTISLVISSVLVLIGYMPPAFVAIYGIIVLLGGTFRSVGRVGIILGGFIGQLLGFAIFNDIILDMPLIGAYAIAGAISLIIPKKYFGLGNWFGYEQEKESEEIHIERVQKIITSKLNHFVEAFNKLSDTFNSVESKKNYLSDKDIRYIIEDTAEKFCIECSMNKFCWKQDLIRTYNAAYQMVSKGEKNGVVTLADIPEKFRQDCLNAENFAYMLNYKLDLYKQETIWHNRLVESRAIVGEQMKAVANSIYTVIQDIDKEVKFNKEEERVLMEALKAQGIKVKDLMVVEKRNKKHSIELYIPYCKKTNNIEDKIINVVEDVLDIKTSVDKHECSQDGCYFKLILRKRFGVIAAACTQAKQEVSGDVYSFMELDDGQYLLALADGMGSGVLAQRESTATIELLEEFMDSGFQKNLAVKLINSALVLKSSEESFSTMDITLIDTYTGIAEFLKAGAATSFILRDQDIISVHAATLPIGILKEVDIEVQKVQLKHGDIIVMVTDGMLDSPNDVLGKEETFKHFMMEVGGGEPQYIAEYLMQKSRDLLGLEKPDDKTIVVAKVWRKI